MVKFSNDGRLMLLTTMDGHIHVLDSFRGTLVSFFSCIDALHYNLYAQTVSDVPLVCVVIHVQCETHFKEFHIGGIF